MKASNQPKGKTSTNSDKGIGRSIGKRIAKCTSGAGHKARGRGEDLLVKEKESSSPSSEAEELFPKPSKNGTFSSKAVKEVPMSSLYPAKTLDPGAKIKLQLFPRDESTRMELEKVGYNPYLELTLKARKKITSVIKHLDNKWGSVSIAVGELSLFPYNLPEVLFPCKRWTLNDVGISAGDVYAVVGNPVIFRLRYGWLASPNCRTIGEPSKATPMEACLQREGVPNGCITNEEEIICSTGDQIKASCKEIKPIITSETMDIAVAEQTPFSGSTKSLDTKAIFDSGPGQLSAPWDSLNSISIGGLLSEASMQGKLNNFDSGSSKSNVGFQSSEFITPSFDALIAAQIGSCQSPRQSHELRSSILDAEDTCHAFSFQKSSSSKDNPLASTGSAYSSQVNEQEGHPLHNCCQESETNLVLCSRLYNDESSLGLRAIKWTDSLGPFDLGQPSSRKIINGDSVSIGGIVN